MLSKSIFEISNSMKPYPSALHAYANRMRPATGFGEPTNLIEVSNRITPTPLYYIIMYCIVLYCIVLYYIILYYTCIVLYYIIMYCIILYYTCQVDRLRIRLVRAAVGADDDEERGSVRACEQQRGGVVELDLSGADLGVSTLIATTASTETLNGTCLGVIVLFVLPLPVPKVTPKTVPSTKNTTRYVIPLRGQSRNPHIYIYIYIYVYAHSSI